MRTGLPPQVMSGVVLIGVTLIALAAMRSVGAREIPVRPLEAAINPVTAPGARVLFDRGAIRVGPGLSLTFTRHRRVRIDDRSGFPLASVAIRHHKSERVMELEAFTLRPDGSLQQVRRSEILKVKEGDWRRVVFAFPRVTAGSEVEWRYRLRSPNFYYLRPWSFQQSVPVDTSELTIDVPDGFEYTAVLTGGWMISGPDTSRVELDTEGEALRRFVWRGVDLPPFVDVPFASFPEEHRARLNFQIARFRRGSRVREFARDWRELSVEVERFYERVLKPEKKWPDRRKLERAFTANARAEYPQRVYRFCRDSIALTGPGESVIAPRTVKVRDVYKRRRGTAIEKNLLLVAMLRRAGYDVYPLLVASRDRARFDRRDRRLSQFDRVLVLFVEDGHWTVLDATTTGLPWGFVRPGDDVDVGVAIGHPDSVIVAIPFESGPHHIQVTGEMTLSPEGAASGTIGLNLVGYPAIALDAMLGVGRVLSGTDGWLFEDTGVEARFEIVHRTSEAGSLSVDLTVTVPGAGRVIGGRIYFRPRQFLRLANNPLTSADRQQTVSFAYDWSEHSDIRWHIPAGYDLLDVPDSVVIGEEGGGLWSYAISTAADSGVLVCRHDFSVRERDYPARSYERLRQFFADVIRAERGLAVVQLRSSGSSADAGRE